MILNYRVFGEDRRPAVFFLHGLLGNADNWTSTCREIAAYGFHCIAVDQRNHGSSPHCAEMSYPLMAEDLAGLADRLSIREFSLVGHSMGGKTAMETALRYPDRVSKLIAADMAPVRYEPVFEKYIKSLKLIDLSRIEKRSDAERELEKNVPDRTLRLFFLTNLRRAENDSYEWRINLDGIINSFDNISAAVEGGRRFTGPALFIRGSESDYVKDGYLGIIGDMFSSYELLTLEGAGHWIHADRPELFRAAVIEFLAGS